MYKSTNSLHGGKIAARDGDIGSVEEFYFDDVTWTIRYLVADTGKWLKERLVLISPDSLRKPDTAGREFPVDLTRRQIENSPDIDKAKPVSRQQEREILDYYNWPVYWTAARPRDADIPKTPAKPDIAEVKKYSGIIAQGGHEDPHLRSTREVIGYEIRTREGEIGDVKDFIIDDESWRIVGLVVDTYDTSFGGKKVLISPENIKSVNWAETNVHVDLSNERIANSPEFDYSGLETGSG